MNFYQQNFSTAKIIIIVGFIVVAYMLYSLAVSYYDNYQIDTHIGNFEQRNAELAAENQSKLENFKYYTSEEYIEKIAKQNLGLVNPGENVIVIDKFDANVVLEREFKEAQSLAIRNSWSNPKKWWRFFLDTNQFKY